MAAGTLYVQQTLRRPRSDDALLRPPAPSSPLVPIAFSSTSTTRTLLKRTSGADLRRPIPHRTWQEPTLVELMAAEERRQTESNHSHLSLDLDDYHLDLDGTGHPTSEIDYRSEVGLGMWEEKVPESAILYPPLYGRPGPSPSPDIFA